MDKTLSSAKTLFLGAVAAAGTGCLALYAWSQWSRRYDQAEPYESSNNHHSSNRTNMGQSQSLNLTSPFDTSYKAIETDNRNGYEEWSITVNPHETGEQQQLIQSNNNVLIEDTLPAATGGRSNAKRAVLRSRTLPEEAGNDGPSTEVVTIQPKSTSPSSSKPVVVTNLRLAEKLRGFSNEEYQNTLQGTLNRLYGSTKLLTVDEAKCLTLILQQKSPDTLLKVLTTMSNLAAFTVNQDLLREHGAIDLLINLLHDDTLSDSAQVMLVQCVGNMAVNQTNNKLLQCCVPRIVHHLLSPSSSELQRVMCVQALTNLSVDTSVTRADEYVPIIPFLYQRLWSHSTVNVSTLRLLVNLSCVSDLVPVMLASEAPLDFLQLIDRLSSPHDVLVRATTFLFYLASHVDGMSMDEEDIRAKCTNLEGSAFYKLFRGDNLRRFREAIRQLNGHENEEVRQRSERILLHLASIQSGLNQAHG